MKHVWSFPIGSFRSHFGRLKEHSTWKSRVGGLVVESTTFVCGAGLQLVHPSVSHFCGGMPLHPKSVFATALAK